MKPGLVGTVSNTAFTVLQTAPDDRGPDTRSAKAPPVADSRDTPTSAAMPVTPTPAPAPDETPSPRPSTTVPASAASSDPAPTARAAASSADESLATQVIGLVNQQRVIAGCGAVTAESHLSAAAQGHSDDMSARSYFSHTTPDGITFDQRIRKAGYGRPGAENIAKGSRNPEQTMRLWMNSSGHRQNILNCSLTKLGVGIATTGWYWTQDFGY